MSQIQVKSRTEGRGGESAPINSTFRSKGAEAENAYRQPTGDEKNMEPEESRIHGRKRLD